MSQPGPRVRSACEACHTRKQRCILPDAGGACQACVQNSRQCYFVPRFRPGRPQRRQTDDRCNRSSNTNTSSSGSSGRGAPSPAAVSPLVNPDVLLNSYIDQGGDASIPCLNLGLQKPASEIAVIELDEYQENMQGLWDTGSAFNFNPNGMDIPDSLQLLTGTASLGETFPGDDLRLHGEAPIDCSPGSKLARQFIHLDSQRESLLPSYAKPMGCEDFCKKIEPCMDTIAKICPQALTLVGKCSTNRDPSLCAIIAATMIKVFDLCETVLSLVEGQLGTCHQSSPSAVFESRFADGNNRPSMPPRTFSSSSTNSISMGSWPSRSDFASETSNAEEVVRFVLTLKQLELHLGQAKICLSLLALDSAAHAGSPFPERSAGLHARIHAAIEAVCV